MVYRTTKTRACVEFSMSARKCFALVFIRPIHESPIVENRYFRKWNPGSRPAAQLFLRSEENFRQWSLISSTVAWFIPILQPRSIFPSPRSLTRPLQVPFHIRPSSRQSFHDSTSVPNDKEMHNLAGSRCYATFELIHVYWQLPLDKSSQSSQSFITTDVIYSPARDFIVRQMP